jgi:hypothetical protein
MKQLITLLIALSPPASETPSPIPTDILVPTWTPSLTPTLPIPTQTLVELFTPNPLDQPIQYRAQSGDSLAAVAARFSVQVQEITSPKDLPGSGLINAGTLLIIPDRIPDDRTPDILLIPDSEVIFSASAMDFDIAGFVTEAGGFLAGYKQLGCDQKTCP